MRINRSILALVAAAGSAPAALADDDCGSPTVVTAGAYSGSTTGLAATPGIPASHCGGTSENGPDYWYSFTATTAGSHSFSLCGSSYDTVISLWASCPDGFSTPLACNDDSCGLQSALTRTLAEGETVLVRVGGYNANAGNYTLTISEPAPPATNDNCADAIAVAVGGSYSGNNSGASNDAPGSCGLSDTSNDLWYAFTAPSSGEFNFSTCDPTGFDTVMSLWDSCGGSEIVCDDDSDYNCSFNAFRAEMHRSMAEGESILIRIAGFNGATGTFILHVSEVAPPPPPPANDECSGAAPIANGDAQPYDTTQATDSFISLAGCGLPTTIHNDIYFAYQASCTGDVTVSLCGTNYDTVLAVFDACGGNQVACDDDSCDGANPPGSTLASTTTFPGVSGSTYIIAVGGYTAAGKGPGVISISCAGSTPTCPADFNDDGFLDFFDYDDYVNCFESGNCPPGKTGDFNNDGFADFFDYDDFVGAFEAGC